MKKRIITSDISRRKFIRNTGTIGAGLIAAPFIGTSAWGKAAPSDTIRHAVIGTGGQGRGLASRFANAAGCELVAVCDVDPAQLEKAVKGLPNEQRIKKYADFRKVIDDKSIDSVSIATPDHWHTPIALLALMAGKHVYVEKPCSHNIRETNLLVKAAQEYKKCVQHGTQREE